MDDKGIDLNLLRVMQAVDQEGSVTQAAQRLGLSQPAVSNALARLRRALGDKLFVRSTHGMEATPRARRVLEALDGAMGLIRQGLRDGTQFDPAHAREEFNLLTSDLGEIVYLPTLMAYLQRHAPLTQVRVRQLAHGGYAEALEAGLADLAVGYLPHPRSSLRSRRLFSDHFVCMVRSGHPMLDAPLTLDSYSALRHVVVSRRAAREGLLTPALAALGVERSVALVVPHFLAAPAIIAVSDLAVTVPSGLARLYGRSGVVGVPLPFAVPPIELALYWHERLQDDAASRWLRGVFVELFAHEAGERPLNLVARGDAYGHYSPG
jgi:DNA-binding transcriptional LysR family regulator